MGLCVVALATLLAAAAPPPKPMTYIYHPPESWLDVRYIYHWEILRTALEKTNAKWGPYRMVPSERMTEQRQAFELKNKTGKLTVMYLSTTPDFEHNLVPIHIPVDKNLGGYCVFLIRKGEQPRFDAVKSLDDLHKFSYGLGLLAQLGDGDALAEERVDPPPPLGRLRAGHDVLAVALVLDGPADDDEQRVELHRLREELLRPELHRFDGRVDRRVRGQDDQRRGVVDGPEVGDQVERRAVGEAEIEHGHVGVKRPKLHPRRGAVVRLVDLEPVRFQKTPYPKTRSGLIIDE